MWAFEEIFAASLPLALPPTTTIHIPTVAGYAAAKVGAWLDRSDWLEAKDAADLALVLHWYAESADVHNRPYETPLGNEILIAEGTDLPLAAAHLLGADVTTTIGPPRLAELLATLARRRGVADPRTRTSWRSVLAPRLATSAQPLGRFDPRARRFGVMTPGVVATARQFPLAGDHGEVDGVEQLSRSRSGAVGTLINRPIRMTGVGHCPVRTSL